ncbi:MAG TPA: hypothetical protein VNE42_04330 [Acidimicrobiales bacterium]|nr:hypothetical protein [Acidimicrobiales bacterium]
MDTLYFVSPILRASSGIRRPKTSGRLRALWFVRRRPLRHYPPTPFLNVNRCQGETPIRRLRTSDHPEDAVETDSEPLAQASHEAPKRELREYKYILLIARS